MSQRNATRGTALGESLAWLWVSLALTAAATARRLLIPPNPGLAGYALDLLLLATLLVALLMLGASTVLIFLSVELPWDRPRVPGARFAMLGALSPAAGALLPAAWLAPSYAPTAAAALLAIVVGAAANAAIASANARAGAGRYPAPTGPGRPGAQG
jgi:hypothetical protein